MDFSINLPDEAAEALRSKAAAAGLSAERYVQRVLERDLAGDARPGSPADDDRPLSAMIREIVGAVPPEELAKLPADGSSQIDHYVYGLPRR